MLVVVCTSIIMTTQTRIVQQEKLLLKTVHSANSNYSVIGGVALHATAYHSPGYLRQRSPQMKLELIDCNFLDNIDKNDYATSASVLMTNILSANVTNSTFSNNSCTALTVIRTNVIFGGQVVIQGNCGTNGGGLALCSGSSAYFRPYTNLRLANNAAKRTGGGVFAEDSCLESKPACFFQLDTEVTDEPRLLETVSITMENNLAEVAGDAIYGGVIDYCFLFDTSTQNHSSSFQSKSVFEQIFHPSIDPNDASFISSDPVGVCFCTSEMKNCSQGMIEKHVYPGQTFQLSLVVVGQRNGTTPGKVVARVCANCSLAERDRIQEIVSRACANLSYTISTREPSTVLSLGISDKSVLPMVNVTLRKCPKGFQLYSSEGCECNSFLTQYKITCDVNGPFIHRRAPEWIGFTNTDQLLYHKVCPLDYCKPTDLDISAGPGEVDQDAQCAFHRRGYLCGCCKDTMSLTLGSLKCKPCSNLYLLLLIPFATAGWVLVLVMSVCHLTVTEGTLNGLIFYANIVSLNYRIFFPTPQEWNILSVFIAWLNLDLGIETCFYDGLDAYAYTWLNFAFPIYLWVIALIIIYVSHWSTVFARLVGRNGVQVLATLFLLSYAKLLRNIITATTLATVSRSDGQAMSVWLYDGNTPYLTGKHIPLFIVAVFFGVLSLPYVLILLLMQCFQKVSNIQFFSWVNRLKPLLDAYAGPYRDRYRYWTGLLLSFRLFVFNGHALNVSGDPDVNLAFAIGTCFLLLVLSNLCQGGLYKKWPLHLLELSFIVNLTVLCVVSVFIGHHSTAVAQAAATSVSVSISLVTFAGIVLLHTYRRIKSSHHWGMLVNRLAQRLQPEAVLEPVAANNQDSTTENDADGDQETRGRPPITPFDQYHEPLLASEDHIA